MGLPHGVSPKILFMYIFISLYISNSFMYIVNFLCTYTIVFVNNQTETNFFRLFSFVCLYTDCIGIKRSIIPGETVLKPMGLPYGVSPNPPTYIYIFLYIN